MRDQASMITLTPPVLFMSDIHLKGDAHDQVFIECIESQIDEIKTLVLVGDLFDFNLGYSSTLYSCFFDFYHAVASWQKRGVEIHIFTGNHDPDPCPLLKQKLGVHYYEHGTLFQIEGRRVYLEHGDALESSFFKRTLCLFVRHHWVRALVRWIPASWVYKWVQVLTSSDSSSFSPHLDSPPQEISLISSVMQRGIQQLPASTEVWMIGHFHYAYAIQSHLNSSPFLSAQNTLDSSTNPFYFFMLGEWLSLHTFVKWSPQSDLTKTLKSDSNSSTDSLTPFRLYRYVPSTKTIHPLRTHLLDLDLNEA